MDPRVIHTATSTIALGADGIVRLFARTSDPLDLIEAEKVLAAIGEVSPGKRAPLLVDLRKVGRLSPEASKCFGQPKAFRNSTAVALVGRSALDRALGNVFLMLTSRAREGVAVKMYGTEEDALAWLQAVAPL